MIGLRLDVFEINANVGGSGDRDEGMIGRVREIEFEPVGEFRAKVRLAECCTQILFGQVESPDSVPGAHGAPRARQ